MKRAALFAILVAGAFGTATSTPLNDDPAREAALQWLQLIDSGRYEEAASQGSQEVHSFEQWINHFKTQRLPLGRMNKRQLAGIKRTAIVPAVPEVRSYLIVRFRTTFEHRPTAIEEIVLTKIGCCWEIFGYQISDK